MLLACLKCTSVLDKARIDEIEVDLCPSCGGLWLDHGEIERLAKKQASDMDKLRRLLTNKGGPPPVPSDITSACPACTSAMKEIALADGKLKLDFCTRCKGVFLDRGEAEAALKAIKDAKATLPQLVAAAAQAVETPAAG